MSRDTKNKMNIEGGWYKKIGVILGVVLLLIVLFIFGREWLSENPQFGGDWHYVFDSHIRDDHGDLSIWETSESLGMTNGHRMYLEVLNEIQHIFFTVFGFGFKVTQILIWFLPFVGFASFGMYALARRFTDSTLGASVSAFMYTLNPYTVVILSEAGHINLIVAYAIVPVMLLRLLILLERQNYYNLFLYITTFSLITLFDIRIGYLSLFIQALFFGQYILQHLVRKRNKAFGMSIFFGIAGVLFFALNMYWIVSLFIVPTSSFTPENFQDAAWIGRLSYQDISHGLLFDHPFMTNDGVEYFSYNPVRIVLLPVFVILSLGFILTSKENKKRLLPLLVVWVLGIFFLKGTNAPLGDVYVFLYERVPGFNMFREPQKFYVWIAIPYTLLLGHSIGVIYEKIASFKEESLLRGAAIGFNVTLSMVIVGISLFSVWPIFTDDVKGAFSARELPAYATAVENLIESDEDPSFYRTLWVPKLTSAAYRTDAHPRLDAFTTLSNYLDTSNDQVMYDFMFTEKFAYFLDAAAVKYVIFPNDPDITRWFNIPFIDLVEHFKNVDYLTVKEESSYIIFENEGYVDLIYMTDNALITDDELAGITRNSADLAKLQLIDSGQIIPDELLTYASQEYNLTTLSKISRIEDNSVEVNFEPASNSAFVLEDTLENPYYKVFFTSEGVDNTYALSLRQIEETVQIENNAYKLSAGVIETGVTVTVSPENNYVVNIEGQDIYFTGNEVISGASTGLIYLGNNQTIDITVFEVGESMYTEDFDSNPEINLIDCTNATNTSLAENGIEAELIADSSGDDLSLLLQSERQNGCISNDFKSAEVYDRGFISIAYKSIEGDSPEFCIFDYDNNECAIRYVLADASQIYWNRRTIYFDLKDNSQNFGLFLYSAAESTRNINIYDSIEITGLTEVINTRFTMPEESVLEALRSSKSMLDDELRLRATKTMFKYNSEIIENVDLTNTSFEDSINYQLNVKDCANEDGSPLEDNRIEANQIKDSTDGRFSLSLSGDRHSACYSVPVGVLEGQYAYYIDFAYRSEPDTATRVCLFNRTKSRCEISKIFTDSVLWEDITLITNNLPENDVYELFLYSYSNLGNDNYYESLFDDIAIYQMPLNFINRFIVQFDKVNDTSEDQNIISYENIRESRKVIQIENYNPGSMLNLAVNFDPNWNLYFVEDESIDLESRFLDQTKLTSVSNNNQFESNRYMNSWILPVAEGGDVTLVLDYGPQIWVEVLTRFSLIVFAVLTLGFLGSFIMRLRSDNDEITDIMLKDTNNGIHYNQEPSHTELIYKDPTNPKNIPSDGTANSQMHIGQPKNWSEQRRTNLLDNL